MKRSPLFVILFLSFIFIVGAQSLDILGHLNTKTPYLYSSGPDVSQALPLPEQCTPLFLSLVSRHGTRNPSQGDVNNFSLIENIVRSLRGKFSPAYSWLGDWRNPFLVSENSNLVPAGEVEWFSYGHRIKQLFPDLLGHNYTYQKFPVTATYKERTIRSANSFGIGFLEGDGILGKTHLTSIATFLKSANDYPLRFFKNCPPFERFRLEDKVYIQTNKYTDRHFPAVALRITDKLGLSLNDWSISNDQLAIIWKLCQAYASIFNETDSWCSLFSDEDVGILNYAEDLTAYYERGYGSGLGWHISSILLQTVVSECERTLNLINNNDPERMRAAFRFAHAETLMPFITLLGMFDDAPFNLTADSPQNVIDNRLWRMSNLVPFAARIEFILFSCNTTSHEAINFDDIKIQIRHNEVPYIFNDCEDPFEGDLSICGYSAFKKKYKEWLEFDFTTACFGNDSSEETHPKHNSSFLIVICTVVSFLLGLILSFMLSLYQKKKASKNFYTPIFIDDENKQIIQTV